MNFKRTRIAPTPNGYLHLGHVFHLFHIQAFQEILGLKVILRFEDHDQNRFRKTYEDQIYKDLETLGITFDEIHRQSTRTKIYQKYHLENSDLFYPCTCSRTTIKIRTSLSYDRHCLSHPVYDTSPHSLRIKTMDDYTFHFYDLNLGHQKQDIEHRDCVVRDKDGFYSYQYCVSLDDCDQDIDLIVRGKDLLSSTATQHYIRSQYNPSKFIQGYYHHDLIVDSSENKLSKSIFSKPFYEHLKERSLKEIESELLAHHNNSLAGLSKHIESQLAK